MEIIKRKPNNEAHVYIPELKDLYRQGRVSRREFLRTATLLGMSFAGASAFLTACAQEEPTATPVPTTAPEVVPKKSRTPPNSPGSRPPTNCAR